MPISTNLLYTSNNNGKKVTKNITYANPQATDENLANFVKALSGLSANTFVSLERVDRHELTVVTEKPSPELSLSPASVAIGQMANTSAEVTVSRLGNGAITATLPDSSTGKFTATVNGTTITIANADDSRGTFDVTVAVAETDEYAAATATLPVTISQSGLNPAYPE